jgi:hypothetical protein
LERSYIASLQGQAVIAITHGMKRTLSFLVIPALSLIAACSSVETDSKNYPMSNEDARRAERGKIFGDEGLTLFGGSKDDDKKGGGLGVNSFLWRASLDTLSFMPITQADPFGGVILTDWFEDPAAKGERFKVNVTILDDRLRSDGIRVAVFKQTLDETNTWRDSAVTKQTGIDLENAILTRARQLRIKQTGK